MKRSYRKKANIKAFNIYSLKCRQKPAGIYVFAMQKCIIRFLASMCELYSRLNSKEKYKYVWSFLNFVQWEFSFYFEILFSIIATFKASKFFPPANTLSLPWFLEHIERMFRETYKKNANVVKETHSMQKRWNTMYFKVFNWQSLYE